MWLLGQEHINLTRFCNTLARERFRYSQGVSLDTTSSKFSFEMYLYKKNLKQHIKNKINKKDIAYIRTLLTQSGRGATFQILRLGAMPT